jgi:hypothetical protein
MSDIYDTECIDRYGSKTCILFQITDEVYELRMLDKTMEDINVTKKHFFEIIPKLLSNKYTVVIVEKCLCLNNKLEIKAIHLPVQSHLTIPPILQ